MDPAADPESAPQKMDVYYPASGGPWPAVVYVHGGSWTELDKAEGGAWAFLRDAGILVVSVNYRLADGEVMFPAMIEDVKCAVRHLRANAVRYNLNAEQIGVMGWSAGGHLAALAGTADASAGWETGEYLDQSSRVQAVVSLAGLSDLTRPMDEVISASIDYAFGAPGGVPSPELVTGSPIAYVTPDDPPFLIVHGTQDAVVSYDQSQALHAWLTAQGVPSTLVTVRDGDHHLRGETASPELSEVIELVKAFLLEELVKP
jgi:acetyl esterase/lipase